MRGKAASICVKRVSLPGGHGPRQVRAPLRCSPPVTTLAGGDSGRESLRFLGQLSLPSGIRWELEDTLPEGGAERTGAGP